MRFILIAFFLILSVQASARKDTTITYYDSTNKKCGKKKAAYYTKTFNNPDGTFGWRKFTMEGTPVHFSGYKTKVRRIKHGEHKAFFNNGQIAEQGWFKDNQKFGKWKQWDADGNLKKEMSFDYNILDDEYKVYDKGVLVEQGFWKNGKKEGLWQNWYSNGNLSAEINFVKGKKEGEEKGYYETGELLYVSTYESGRILNTLCYDESGNEEECDSTVFTEVEPSFPGGEQEMFMWIMEQIQYPETAIENNEQGVVYVQFVVNKDGSIEQIKVIRGVSDSIDAEAIRVIKTMPNWEPGTQKGNPVRVRYTVPIHFRLG